MQEQTHGHHHAQGRQQVLRRRSAIIPDVDLDIEDGEFVVFVGPSGCGKSTLLRLIAGLEDVDRRQDHHRRHGRDRCSRRPSAGSSMVFQSYALYPHMSVRNNIAFGAARWPAMPKAEIDAKVGERRATS